MRSARPASISGPARSSRRRRISASACAPSRSTADYVQNYVQGGRILIKHQAVALRLADMATKIEAVRALLERAAQAVDDNAPDADTLCNMAKMFASEEIMKVAQHAVELHGGNGMMLDFGVEKVLRDAVDLPAHGRAPSTSRSSRSSRTCSRTRRENTPGRSERYATAAERGSRPARSPGRRAARGSAPRRARDSR